MSWPRKLELFVASERKACDERRVCGGAKAEVINETEMEEEAADL